MDVQIDESWKGLSAEEKKRQLYEKQKQTLELFLARGSITQQQYGKSLHDLTEKMGYTVSAHAQKEV